ncbi:hypothetical protein BH11PLA1_BH11PLA1_23880 [soil metagenome]
MSNLDWQIIRARAKSFPEAAFQFVREGLGHTVRLQQGEGDAAAQRPRHVSGQQLSLGLRDFAIDRFGMLAGTVLRKWGVRRTEDFGTIVYGMIDSGEMRASPEDSLEDFISVFDFEEAFGMDRAAGAAS